MSIDLDKIADIADDFMEAAGVPFGTTGLGVDLMDDLSDDEQQFLADTALDGFADAIAGDIDSLNQKTVELAELFAKVARRTGRDQDAQNCIPLNDTDDTTADRLDQLGAHNLADIVRDARSSRTMSP